MGGRYSREGNQDPLGAFTVLNLSGIYEVNPQMEIYARVDNLLDEEYEEVLLFGTPVRSIFGGVRMNFEVPIPAWGDT